MSGVRVNIPALRERAELTLNRGVGPWLPYEETWHELATGVLALVEAVEAARHCIQTGTDEDGTEWVATDPRGQMRLYKALAVFDFGDAPAPDENDHTRVLDSAQRPASKAVAQRNAVPGSSPGVGTGSPDFLSDPDSAPHGGASGEGNDPGAGAVTLAPVPDSTTGEPG